MDQGFGSSWKQSSRQPRRSGGANPNKEHLKSYYMGQPGGVHLSGHNKLSLKIIFWETANLLSRTPAQNLRISKRKKKKGGDKVESGGKKETEEIF